MMSEDPIQNQPSDNNFPVKGTMRAATLVIFELAKIIALAVVTIVLVRYFLFKPFYVKGASMVPNFEDKEYLIIDEITYRFRAPERGEVIVFKHAGSGEYFLKRIIGLPGERIKIAEGMATIYNADHPEGSMLDESYLPGDLATIGIETIKLNNNQYFVMGDNRMNSFDSRMFGPIDKQSIVGRAWFRGWPISRMQTFSAPTYNVK